jgi:type VII secretion protein EccB
VGAPWSVCVQAVTNQSTQLEHTVTTLVGGRGVGGSAVPASNALLVQAAGSDWLIWDGQRLLIPNAGQRDSLFALGTRQTPESMPSAWLNAFPQGSDFAPPAVDGFGNPTTGPGGGSAHVGQVFTTTPAPGTPEQSYVMLTSGLAAITQTQAALLNSATGQVPPQTVAPSAAASDLSKTSVPTGGLPAHVPTMFPYNPTSALCVVYQSSATTAPSSPQVTVGGTVPSYALATNGLGGVSQIALPPGTAALIGVVASAQPAAADTGQAPVVSSYFLLTGGLRYGLASPSVAGVLGYTLPGQQTLLPAAVVDLIPAGPAFDPSKAQQQVAS